MCGLSTEQGDKQGRGVLDVLSLEKLSHVSNIQMRKGLASHSSLGIEWNSCGENELLLFPLSHYCKCQRNKLKGEEFILTPSSRNFIQSMANLLHCYYV